MAGMPQINRSANVILAKARAMYGNSLKPQNYSEMLACHTVGEVASYLKNRTAYGTTLHDIHESSIHRGYLEALLKRKAFQDLMSLLRYDNTGGAHISDYLIQRAEMTQIMRCLLMMSAGRSDEYLFSLPMYFTEHAKFDLLKMGHARDYDQFLRALEGSPYYEILKPFKPEKGEPIRIPEIENVLYKRVVETLNSVIEQMPGSTQKELTALCGSQIDTKSMLRIYRMKKYFHSTPEEIRPFLLPSGHCISEKMWEQMVEAPTAEDVLAMYYSTPVGKRVPEEERESAYNLKYRVSYYNARHLIHFSINPMVVLMSYHILSEVELYDIVNVIEGVRYAMPSDEIRPMLVIANY